MRLEGLPTDTLVPSMSLTITLELKATSVLTVEEGIKPGGRYCYCFPSSCFLIMAFTGSFFSICWTPRVLDKHPGSHAHATTKTKGLIRQWDLHRNYAVG